MVAQKSSGLPWFTQAYPQEGCHFSGERGRALRAPRRPRRPRRPGDGKGPQHATAVVAVLKSFQRQSQTGAVP